MVKLLYFASVRAKIGQAEEEIPLPESVKTVGELVSWLARQSDRHHQALHKPEMIKAAVNQNYAPFDQSIKEGDEVALFPPVTGG